MKVLVVLFVLLPALCVCQDFTEDKLMARLKPGGSISADVLSKRSVVLHSYTLTAKEITIIHDNMVRTGIDAIAYFEIDLVLAGRDIVQSYTDYFIKREVASLVIIQKNTSGYTISVAPFNGKVDLVNADQPAWSARGVSLSETLNVLFQSALESNKQKNLLINEVPETDLPVTVVDGRRSELFPYDLKVDKLAVPTFGEVENDKALEELLKGYPLANQIVDNTIPESELRKKGILYVLCYVHTRSGAAKSLLGYPVSSSESAFVSVTYPEGQVQLKNIPASTSIYKFYVRHIDSGNIFLGTKWDADTSWQQALKNYIAGFKAELKIN